jgi:hypothetical protein
MAVGQQSTVADALEAARQRMQEKLTNELFGRKSHHFRWG